MSYLFLAYAAFFLRKRARWFREKAAGFVAPRGFFFFFFFSPSLSLFFFAGVLPATDEHGARCWHLRVQAVSCWWSLSAGFAYCIASTIQHRNCGLDGGVVGVQPPGPNNEEVGFVFAHPPTPSSVMVKAGESFCSLQLGRVFLHKSMQSWQFRMIYFRALKKGGSCASVPPLASVQKWHCRCTLFLFSFLTTKVQPSGNRRQGSRDADLLSAGIASSS